MFNRLNNIPTISIQNNEILSSYLDNDLPASYHPHLYNVKTGENKTPLEAFNNKVIMTSVIEKFISKNADFSLQNLRYEICRADKTKRTSLFPVRVAKTLFTLALTSFISSFLLKLISDFFSISTIRTDPEYNIIFL